MIDGLRSKPIATVIVVVFNSESTVRDCLASIPADFEVVVVDQNSIDNSVEVALEARPDARIIRNETNSGYSAGCNAGACLAKGASLIFLNPDAAFLSPDVAHSLAVSALTLNVLAAPAILDSNRSDVTLVREWTTPLVHTGELLFTSRWRIGSRLLSDYGYVSGPCLAISAGNFWAVGGFDERFFLYREEETLARRLGEIGVRSFLDPTVFVSHVGGVSTSQVADFAFGQSVRSRVLFYVLHFPRPVAALVSFALLAHLLLSAFLAPVVRTLGIRPNAQPSWRYLRATKELLAGWRVKPVTPPDC